MTKTSSRAVFLPLLLAALLLAALLAGCGGGGSVLRPALPTGPLSRAAGAATFSVKWPDRPAPQSRAGRLIPAASNSIVLSVSRAGTVLAVQTLVRPASSVSLPNLPVGTLVVSASAYPSAAGTGAVQASASAPLVITSGQSTPLTLTLADAVASLAVSSLSQSLPLGGTLALVATAHDASGNVVLTGGSIGWASSDTSVATVSSSGVVSGLAVGSAQITATDSESGVYGAFAVNCVTSAPYGGVAAAIPGQIEAENYDLGGQNVAYYDDSPGNSGGGYRSDDVDIEGCGDTGGGYLIGYIAAGEWTKYTVNVASAGEYTVSFRLAIAKNGQTLHMEDSSGRNLTGPVSCPYTGSYQDWQTVTTTAALPAGVQTLKVCFDGPGYGPYNFNWFALQPVSAQLLSGTLFDDGYGSYGGTSATADKAYDGDVGTFYDCANAAGGYTGIDLGTASSVSYIVFASRQYGEGRMTGGVFEGSNTSATAGYSPLATVTQQPGDGLTNTLIVTDKTAYRWLRYRGPSGTYCNVAEVQFYH